MKQLKQCKFYKPQSVIVISKSFRYFLSFFFRRLRNHSYAFISLFALILLVQPLSRVHSQNVVDTVSSNETDKEKNMKRNCRLVYVIESVYLLRHVERAYLLRRVEQGEMTSELEKRVTDTVY